MSDSATPHSLAISTVFICLILIIYIITSHAIEVKKIRYIHESAISIILGVLFGLLIELITSNQIEFDHQLFFSIILPPIIFSAGFNLRKKYFFQNFGIIQFYGIFGTILSFCVISWAAFLLNESEWFFDSKLSVREILLFSAVLCATDTVAILNMVKEQKFPQLHSILFGEGIMNDAIAIVIYRSIESFTSQDEQNSTEFTFGTMYYYIFSLFIFNRMLIILYFFYLLFFSVVIGAAFGLGVSFFFKKFDSYNNFPLREISFILLFAYIAYLTSELLGFSGIISLFVCGVLMGHYAYSNISEQAQTGTHLIFESVSYIAEAFVFAYLGVSITSMNFAINPLFFTLLMILAIFLARFMVVFSLPCLASIFRRDIGLQNKELKLVWYSGLIRGAIAFALSLQIVSHNSETLRNSVMYVVVITIVVLSSLLQSFQRCVGFETSETEYDIKNSVIDKQKAETISAYSGIGSYNMGDLDNQSRIKQSLTKFEQDYIKPVFARQNNNIKEIDLTNFKSKSSYKANDDEPI